MTTEIRIFSPGEKHAVILRAHPEGFGSIVTATLTDQMTIKKKKKTVTRWKINKWRYIDRQADRDMYVGIYI